ncbi:MAG: transketolase C-terminal domain-containing protein [Kiritimatiellae bacterium]|nr:transketolase C-terminal domain-containing protein [Kiritimatiellia bacterium]MDD5521307.1 transketolase C-terminal domain-containing protein [Kiritimatiellia bacterium]
MRRAFSNCLIQMARQNPRVIFLTGDLGFQIFDEFKKEFSSRYVNVGVAEAQLMLAAAGLAKEGWRPIAYSIASFATARPFEQIRISICYPNMPVVIVGAGGGYTYSNSGVTHQSPDDLGLMSMLPGMTVVAPGCPSELSMLMPGLFSLKGPSYLRIGRFGEPDYQSASPAEIGKARLLRNGEKVAIMCTGDIGTVVIQAVEFLNRDGITPIVYQMHTIKPLDTDVLNGLAKKVKSIILVEEHLPSGGLFSAVAAWLVTNSRKLRLVRLGAPDIMITGSPRREELRRRIGCDAESIRQACVKEWDG